jgi:peptide/nickel transport system permease protein
MWLFLLAFPGLVTSQSPYDLDSAAMLKAPSGTHWFGTDEAGRDVFARCIWGLRYSLGAAVLTTFGAAVFGTIIGGIAGLMGGWVDPAIMRVTDVFLAFPYLILAIAIAAAAGPSLKTCVVTLIIIWWPSWARMIRGQILSLREAPFIEGARATMTPSRRLLYRHLFPHLMPQISARASMEIGYVVIALTGLGFLGLGAQPPTPELGDMIAEAHDYMLQAWWYATLPGLFILAAVTSAMAIGDWLEARAG